MPSNSSLSPRVERAATTLAVIVAAIACLAVASVLVPSANAQSASGNEIIEEVIPKNDTGWRYNESLSDLGTTWRDLNYTYGPDWKTGPARFGNDGCCNTLLNVDPYENAVYLRKEFTVSDLDQVTAMHVSFQYDDAAILWLNGTEVYRTIRGNLPATGEVPYNYDVMTGGAEDLYVEMPGNNYVEFHPELGSDLSVWVPAIDTANLREGNNVFAVMLFNRRGSLDTSTDLALELTRDLTPPTTPTPTATVQPTPTPTTEPDSIASETSCLESSGRVDVTIMNTATSAKTYAVDVGAIARSITIPAAGTDTVTVTGRNDGPLEVTVSESGAVLHRETVTVSCYPDVEVSTETSCVAKNGRLDFYVKNVGTAATTYSVTVGHLRPRDRWVLPGQRKRISVTGRPDGPIDYTVVRDGLTVSSGALTVDCDPNVPVLIETSCLALDGRIDTYLNNATTRTNTYKVTIGEVISRSQDLASAAHGRVTVTGRPDGEYAVMVWENQTPIHSEKVSIACDG